MCCNQHTRRELHIGKLLLSFPFFDIPVFNLSPMSGLHRTRLLTVPKSVNIMKKARFLLSFFLIFTAGSSTFAREISLAERIALIEKYSDIAVKQMHATGVPAGIILAQFILESQWGRGELFLNTNAGFGIKRNGKAGEMYKYKDDDRDADGNLIYSEFRTYATVEDSFIDHGDYLKNRGKYDELFKFSRFQYKQWAHGLKRCGYATDPDYGHKLIRLIEQYELFKYDYLPAVAEVTPAVPQPQVIAPARTETYSPVAAPQKILASPVAPPSPIFYPTQPAPVPVKPTVKPRKRMPWHYSRPAVSGRRPVNMYQL